VIYIATVLLTPWIEDKYSKYERMKLPSSVYSNLQTAFWFQNSNTDNDSSEHPSESTSNLNEMENEKRNESEYKFLILDEHIDINEEMNVNKFTNNMDNIEKKRDEDDYGGDDQAMINLSGGSQSGPVRLIENHFHSLNSNETASEVIDDDVDRNGNDNYENDREKNRKSIKTNSSNFEIYDDIINDEQDSLLRPLLSDEGTED